MTKEKIIIVGVIVKKADILIFTGLKIRDREECEGQRKWPVLLSDFSNLSLCTMPLSKSITEGCMLSLNLKPYITLLSGLASHG